MEKSRRTNSREFLSYYRAYFLRKKEDIALRARQTLALTLVLAILLPGYLIPHDAQAATYTFVQTDWSGGADTVTTANHTSNRTGWTKFYSTDANIDSSGGTLKLTTTSATATTTKYLIADTAQGATTSVAYAGAEGTGSGVTLCTYNHNGLDWTPANGDAYDLDSTSAIGIAGTHCNIGTFTVTTGTTNVYAYDGTKYGMLTIYAKNVTITGTLTATGKGYGSDTGPGKGAVGGSGSGGGHGGVGGAIGDPFDGSQLGGARYD